MSNLVLLLYLDDLFGELHKMLAKMPKVEELNPVPDAHVPVMNFKFDGVSIDLLYAQLDLWVIQEDLDIYKNQFYEMPMSRQCAV